MSQSNTLTVQILDKEYCINCPDDERANLESAARYLDGKMREIRSSGKVIGADRVAVMAALNITHDLLHRKAPGPGKQLDPRARARTARSRRPRPGESGRCRRSLTRARPIPGILASAPWCVGQSVMSLSR